ncbi:hypothetical protein DJ94_5010 [Bacillus pseudomycoides]|nr:hypothetical protein DJ94_5010 [Bacillus pseudomycoides]
MRGNKFDGDLHEFEVVKDNKVIATISSKKRVLRAKNEKRINKKE